LESELCPNLITKPPTLAIVLGSGFHHVLTGLRVEKSPLRCGMGWIKVAP
jgi:hypothetical protein